MLERLGDHWRSVARGRHFHLQAVVRGRREEAVERAVDEIRRQRGDVLDHRQFSDLSLAMIVELEGAGVAALADALARLGWRVDLEPAREALAAAGGARLEGTVQLTFPEGAGELRVPQPAVPG